MSGPTSPKSTTTTPTRTTPTTTNGSASFVEEAIDVLLRRRRPAWTLAIMRVLFGFVLLGWTATMAADVDGLLGSNALTPKEFGQTGTWRYFDLGTTGAVWVAIVALLVASVAIIVGFQPTGWLVLSFVLLVAIQGRNPVILNSGDLLIRNLALLLALTPTGAALSVDRWRRHGRAALRTAPLVAPWGMRLIQFQLMVVYFFAFWSKSGDLWQNGTAVSTAFRLEDLQRISAPRWLIENVIIIAVFSWGALAIELSLAMLLWVKRLRPLLIALGFSLHLFIDMFVLVGFFGPLMMTMLLAFADADWIDRQIQRRFTGRAGTNNDGTIETPANDADRDDGHERGVSTMPA